MLLIPKSKICPQCTARIDKTSYLALLDDNSKNIVCQSCQSCLTIDYSLHNNCAVIFFILFVIFVEFATVGKFYIAIYFLGIVLGAIEILFHNRIAFYFPFVVVNQNERLDL